MAKWPTPQEWFPINTAKWLRGSTRYELTTEERAVWTDFLALAADVGGTGEIPKRPITQLSHQLNVTDVLLEKCINRFIETGKIEAYLDKWVVKNWFEYQAENWKPAKSRRKKNNQDICGDKTNGENSYSDSIRSRSRSRSRIEEEEILSSSPQISELIATFNAIVKKLDKVERITDKRKAKIRTRLEFQPDLEWWKKVFEKADTVNLPPNEKYPDGWRPSFDWLIDNDTNPIKVSEGRYDKHRQTPQYLKGLEKRWKEATDRERERVSGSDDEASGGVRPGSEGREDRPLPTEPDRRRLPDRT